MHYSLNVTRLEQKPTNLAELLKRQQQQQQTNKQTNCTAPIMERAYDLQ